MAAFAAGRATLEAAAALDPVVLDAGVPVGVSHSPAGAIAAGADYVAAEHRTSATDPRVFRRLLAQDWTAGAGAGDLEAAERSLAQSPAPAGLRLLAGVAAGKLDSYRGDTARVELWSQATFWSPTLAPTQTWQLDALTLHWSDGRWRVSLHAALRAPVPAWATVDGDSDTAGAFDAALPGMTAPDYETVAR